MARYNNPPTTVTGQRCSRRSTVIQSCFSTRRIVRPGESSDGKSSESLNISWNFAYAGSGGGFQTGARPRSIIHVQFPRVRRPSQVLLLAANATHARQASKKAHRRTRMAATPKVSAAVDCRWVLWRFPTRLGKPRHWQARGRPSHHRTEILSRIGQAMMAGLPLPHASLPLSRATMHARTTDAAADPWRGGG
jgi:hypothetical protein